MWLKHFVTGQGQRRLASLVKADRKDMQVAAGSGCLFKSSLLSTMLREP